MTDPDNFDQVFGEMNAYSGMYGQAISEVQAMTTLQPAVKIQALAQLNNAASDSMTPKKFHIRTEL
jgi:hypothetical protein